MLFVKVDHLFGLFADQGFVIQVLFKSSRDSKNGGIHAVNVVSHNLGKVTKRSRVVVVLSLVFGDNSNRDLGILESKVGMPKLRPSVISKRL